MEHTKPNYKNTIIYYIELSDGRRYHGHTVNKRNRIAVHKHDYKRYPTYPLYKAMAETGYDINNLQLIEIEQYPCNTIQEAKERERWWIENHSDSSLHKCTPNRTAKEREPLYRETKAIQRRLVQQTEAYKQKAKTKYEQTKAYESERHKVWYQHNKEKVAKKYQEQKEAIKAKKSAIVTCEVCKCEITKQCEKRHLQTEKHKANVAKQS